MYNLSINKLLRSKAPLRTCGVAALAGHKHYWCNPQQTQMSKNTIQIQKNVMVASFLLTLSRT